MDVEEAADMVKRRRFHFGKTVLFLLITSYALLGAVIFKFLEGGEHRQLQLQTTFVQKSREDCLKELWLITGEF